MQSLPFISPLARWQSEPAKTDFCYHLVKLAMQHDALGPLRESKETVTKNPGKQEQKRNDHAQRQMSTVNDAARSGQSFQ